jgi:hypothetical protein
MARTLASKPARRPAVATVAAVVLARRPPAPPFDGDGMVVFIALTPCI